MYFVYILRCEDNSLYTGITTDLKRRFNEHSGVCSGGAKYTASRRPVKFEAAFSAEGRSAASKLEYRIKALKRTEKELLISGQIPMALELGECSRLDIDFVSKQWQQTD